MVAYSRLFNLEAYVTRTFTLRIMMQDFPPYSGMFFLLLVIKLYRVYMQEVSNHSPTLPLHSVAIFFNETPGVFFVNILWQEKAKKNIVCTYKNYLTKRERSGSVVECLTRDQKAAGLSLTGVTLLWSLSKTHLS